MGVKDRGRIGRLWSECVLRTLLAQPGWVNMGDALISCQSRQIRIPRPKSHRIVIQELAELWVVPAGSVVHEPGINVVELAGEGGQRCGGGGEWVAGTVHDGGDGSEGGVAGVLGDGRGAG